MRRGKMHIFRLVHGMGVPLLFHHIHVGLFVCHRLRHQKVAIIIIKGNASQFILIRLVKKVHFLLDIPTVFREIALLYGVIVGGVGNLAHAHQIVLQTLSGLFDKLLRVLYIFLPGGIDKTVVHHKPHDQHQKDGDKRKRDHDGRLNLSGFQLTPEL